MFRLFLHGCLLSGHLNDRQVDEIDRFVSDYSITDTEYAAVASSLRVTPDEVNKLHTASASNVCKICLERDIDCILLPCAHFVSCSFCAAKQSMKQCPVCRHPISETKMFFRA